MAVNYTTWRAARTSSSISATDFTPGDVSSELFTSSTAHPVSAAARMFAAEIEEILAENPLRNSFEVAVASTDRAVMDAMVDKLSAMEGEISVIDPAPAVARHLLDVMTTEGLIRKDGFRIELHSSGDDTSLTQLYKKIG